MEDLEDSPASALKAEFVRRYGGSGHVREAIPNAPTELIPVGERDLGALHRFARANPIYHNWYDMEILGVPCTVYEGDINEHWISSTKHDASNQPFYPTWILSAYMAALESKRMGAEQIVDIGSGDGRISYCGSVLGLDSHGIEIDGGLSDLQRGISGATGVGFGVWNADADGFDYRGSIRLTRPAFFIGGLPEMGEMLAKSVVSRILSHRDLARGSLFVFMGSFQLKKFSRSREKWGWGFFMDEAGLDVVGAVVLPTCWTMDQRRDTPYIFARAGRADAR